MKIASLVVLLMTSSALFSLAPKRCIAATYFVNFDAGHDRADGLTSRTAWQHAPGDRNATAEPQHITLHPGDRLMFAAGVRYRGELKLNGSGTQQRPIILEGEPGPARAVIDGSDPILVQHPCASSTECGGRLDWRRLTYMEFDHPLLRGEGLFLESGFLYPSQSPSPRDSFNADDVTEFERANGADLKNGLVPLPTTLARKLSNVGDGRLLLEVYGNLLVTRPITTLDGNTAHFDAAGLRFNEVKDAHYAVYGHPALISREGEYGFLPGDKSAIALLPNGVHKIFVASGRGGIDLNSSSYVAVKNLDFMDMSDDGKTAFSGVAIKKNAAGSDISIIDCNFADFHLPAGAGPISVNFTSNLVISNNTFENLLFGSAIRLYKDSDITIENNDIRRIGRTGIMLMNVKQGNISNNTIRDAVGIHGNGISAYLDNIDLNFSKNTVTNAIRPVTFGHGSPGLQNRLIFRENLFVGTPSSDAALTSWGDTHAITLDHNIILSAKGGLALSASDTGVIVSNNEISGELVVKHLPYMRSSEPDYIPPPWVISKNSFDGDNGAAANSFKPGVLKSLEIRAAKEGIGANGMDHLTDHR